MTPSAEDHRIIFSHRVLDADLHGIDTGFIAAKKHPASLFELRRAGPSALLRAGREQRIAGSG
jgi:hypothetical protein